MSEPERRRFVVRGRVQGVGFRDFVRREARLLGLAGWVRNHIDGSVELEAVGPAPALERLHQALAIGPPSGRVAAVEESRLPAPNQEATGFHIVA